MSDLAYLEKHLSNESMRAVKEGKEVNLILLLEAINTIREISSSLSEIKIALNALSKKEMEKEEQ